LTEKLGGIGSWAASMLIKSGVGKIRIIDFDQVSLSGLNQHATANRNDVGTPKAIAMKKAFRTIAPWVHVDAKVERLQEDSAAFLLSGMKFGEGVNDQDICAHGLCRS
jgi:tRNA A37 threonylcarbamoyladenosine dehydratase